MEPTPAPPTIPPKARTRNRLWIWFFLLVTALTVGATAFLAWFNLQVQLTPEKLTRQIEQWGKQAPENYFAVFTVRENETPIENSFRSRLGLAPSAPEGEAVKYSVRVRQGVVVEARENDRILPKSCWDHLAMDRLFERVKVRMDQDRSEGRRVYLRARFEEKTGALLEYVRRVMRRRERQEIAVSTFRYGAALEDR